MKATGKKDIQRRKCPKPVWKKGVGAGTTSWLRGTAGGVVPGTSTKALHEGQCKVRGHPIRIHWVGTTRDTDCAVDVDIAGSEERERCIRPLQGAAVWDRDLCLDIDVPIHTGIDVIQLARLPGELSDGFGREGDVRTDGEGADQQIDGEIVGSQDARNEIWSDGPEDVVEDRIIEVRC